MATRLRRAIYHESDPYAFGNDIDGDEVAAARGVWIDHDLNFCRYLLLLIFIVTHWPHPKREGFRAPNGKVPARAFRYLTWATVSRLRTKDGHRIRTAAQVIRDDKQLGVKGIEFDLKVIPTLRQFWSLRRAARKGWGTDWKRHVEVKIWCGFSGWRTALRRAHRVGFTTTVIRYSGDPADLPKYVDHYRR